MLLGKTPIFFLPHATDMLINSFSHKLEVVVTKILWKLEIRFKTDLRKIYENPDRGIGDRISLSSAGASFVL